MVVRLKALDPNRPIREADVRRAMISVPLDYARRMGALRGCAICNPLRRV